jgi:O-antigen/teichoic acid export membrane protein
MHNVVADTGEQVDTRVTSNMYQRIWSCISAFLAVIRLKSWDTSTEEGRSKERYRRAFLTTAASFASRGATLLTSLITIPLTLRYLGAERYGLWIILTSIIAAMSIADLGIGNGLVNAIAEADGKDDRHLAREYVSSGFYMLVLIAVTMALMGTFAFPFIPWLRVFNVTSIAIASEGSKAFAVLFAWFVVNIPLGVVARIQTGLQRGYTPQILSAVGGCVSLAGVLFAIHLRASLPLLVFASTVGAVFAILLNGALLFKAQPWLLPMFRLASLRSASKILKLGLLFFVMQTAIAVGYTSDNIVIGQILGARAVAAYAVPQKLFGYATIALMFSLGPLWPAYGEAISRRDYAWAKRTFRRSMFLTFFFTIALNTVLVIACPAILRHWTGQAIMPQYSLLLLLGIWGVITGVSTAVSMFLNAAGIVRFQASLAVVMATMNITISIFLTRRIGISGVVAGSIIAQIIIMIPTLLMLPVFIRKIQAAPGPA